MTADFVETEYHNTAGNNTALNFSAVGPFMRLGLPGTAKERNIFCYIYAEFFGAANSGMLIVDLNFFKAGVRVNTLSIITSNYTVSTGSKPAGFSKSRASFCNVTSGGTVLPTTSRFLPVWLSELGYGLETVNPVNVPAHPVNFDFDLIEASVNTASTNVNSFGHARFYLGVETITL